ncbi:MAG: ribosome biogenesis GTP-binding protein YihA/YsxC [Pseudomonadota bacterium]
MSHYPNAQFLTSADKAHQFCPDLGAEVAFAGRSNAGKSSAINAIVNRRQFARTSKTPGRTQLVNFFTLSEETRLVDLPGYGFAKVADRKKDHWRGLMNAYFLERKSLTGLFLIVDIRRGMQEFDLQMIELAANESRALHVLLTKADKFKRGAQNEAKFAAERLLPEGATLQLFSATKKSGLEEARSRLDAMLAVE